MSDLACRLWSGPQWWQEICARVTAQRRMARAAWMEKIMSNSSDEPRELREDELNLVSGGDGYENYGPVVQGMIDLWHNSLTEGGGTPSNVGGGGARNLRAA